MLTRKRPQSGTQRLDSPYRPQHPAPLIGLLVLYLTATPGLAKDGDRPPRLNPVSQRTTTPYPAVRLTSFVFDQPRPIRAWSARIDLTAEGVELIATCPGDVEPPSETACATTLAFAKSETVQLAINASPFSPFRQKSGAGMDVVGLAACNGKVFSQPHQDFGALVETQSGSVEIWSPPIDRAQQDTIEDAVSGFRVLVRDGKSQAEQVAAKALDRHRLAKERLAPAEIRKDRLANAELLLELVIEIGGAEGYAHNGGPFGSIWFRVDWFGCDQRRGDDGDPVIASKGLGDPVLKLLPGIAKSEALSHSCDLGRLLDGNVPTGAGFSFAFAKRQLAHGRPMSGLPQRRCRTRRQARRRTALLPWSRSEPVTDDRPPWMVVVTSSK
jgi:hypothetical protein